MKNMNVNWVYKLLLFEPNLYYANPFSTVKIFSWPLHYFFIPLHCVIRVFFSRFSNVTVYIVTVIVHTVKWSSPTRSMSLHLPTPFHLFPFPPSQQTLHLPLFILFLTFPFPLPLPLTRPSFSLLQDLPSPSPPSRDLPSPSFSPSCDLPSPHPPSRDLLLPFSTVGPQPSPSLSHNLPLTKVFFSFAILDFFSSSSIGVFFCCSSGWLLPLLWFCLKFFFFNIVQRSSGFFYKNPFSTLEISTSSLLQDLCKTRSWVQDPCSRSCIKDALSILSTFWFDMKLILSFVSFQKHTRCKSNSSFTIQTQGNLAWQMNLYSWVSSDFNKKYLFWLGMNKDYPNYLSGDGDENEYQIISVSNIIHFLYFFLLQHIYT